MEKNNFDNQIKKQLDQRTLEPAAKSWEQLRSKLDRKDKKTMSVFWWRAAAASFVGGILLTGIVFHKPLTNPQIQVTENNPEIILETNENHILQESTQIQETLVQQEIILLEKTNPVKTTQAGTGKKPEEVIKSKNNIPVLEEKQQQLLVNVEKAIAGTTDKTNDSNLTDDEVDALLEQALAEISERKFQNKEAISANQLLEEVEEEVERSFRERVFEMLKDGFNQSREALANRNQ